MNPIVDGIKALVKPVSDIFVARTVRKQTQDEIKGKVQLARQGDETTVTLSQHQWEHIGKTQEDNTWKDEYVTVSFVAPINVIVLDSILMAMGISDGTATQGTLAAIKTLNQIGIPMGTLMTYTVGAALSLKLFKGFK